MTPTQKAIATPPGEDTEHKGLSDDEKQAIQARWEANTPTLSELKTQRKRAIKREARQILRETDWRVVRSTEQQLRGRSPADLPQAVVDHRDEVRALEDDASARIDAADSAAEVRTITVDWPDPPDAL